MNIRVQREPTTPAPAGHQAATLSVCFVDDVFFAFGLEDEVREVPGQPVEAWKVPGATAIPARRYAVAMTYSPRFGRVTPEILDVPGFTGIRIHPLNEATETEGCYGLGVVRAGAAIRQSTAPTSELCARIAAALERGDAVSIEFRNPPSWYHQHGITEAP